MNPSFVVPAEYFYALTAHLPSAVGVDTRYRTVTRKSPEQLLIELRDAITRNVIDDNAAPELGGSAITPEQAVRRLNALGQSTGPEYVIEPTVSSLVQEWLDFPTSGPPDREISEFWFTEVSADASLQAAHLRLVLAVIAGQSDPSDLIDALSAEFGVTDVEGLVSIDVGQWQSLFENNPALLPDNTRPGSTEERARAFIRRLQQFFDITLASPPLQPAVLDQPAVFEPSATDPIVDFLASYGGGFPLAAPIDEVAFDAALFDVFPSNEAAREWLRQAVLSFNELVLVTTSIAPDTLRFSVMEGLYARGFTSQETIAALSLEDFRTSLVGTVAYPFADAIYAEAGGGGGPAVDEPAPEFQPVNPNGLLVNCLVPPYRSALGPASYLQEMLRVSDLSTCAEPAPEDAEQVSLNSLIDGRRGAVGEILVTAANLNVPLPLVDLVNECLEHMAATTPGPVTGVVYNTASDSLHEHALIVPGVKPGPGSEKGHDATTLFSAVPEHSSPATPVELPEAYERLRADFSAPGLPYSQPLDICRSYLSRLCTNRYEVMRRFRQHITEFVLAPDDPQPVGFVTHQWRYPVRAEIAFEYLEISPEESALFRGEPTAPTTAELFGFSDDDVAWPTEVLGLDTFLDRLGLSYCEFLDLVKSEFAPLSLTDLASPPAAGLPECEPCCLAEYSVVLPAEDLEAELRRIAIFVRLWRKLMHLPCARYSFVELADICEVLQLELEDQSLNPGFLRQLAAFQMLRDDFALELYDATDEEAGTGADRVHLLALWVGPEARKWPWAVEHLIDQIDRCAPEKHHCKRRPPQFLKLLRENLVPLSLLAGFHPGTPAESWHALPTHTLRFTEVLSKIYASGFGIGEILFLFTVDPHLAGDDPFPLQPPNEARESPLALPDDESSYYLWELRRKLLAIELSDEDARQWTWERIVNSLHDEFGYPADLVDDPLQAAADHFFPETVAAQQGSVDPHARQYRAPLASTSAPLWNTPEGPFGYDVAEGELFTALPLTDEAVLRKLQRVRQLDLAEQDAVRQLYFAPRTDLSRLAFLFPNFAEAESALIQEPDESARWLYFQKSFATFHRQAQIIAEHLTSHIGAVTGMGDGDVRLAKRLLTHLRADENFAITAWENDSGVPPAATWGPTPHGGAVAALVGLVGTGLLGEYRPLEPEGADVVFRELRGPTRAFGDAQNVLGAAVPTVLPSMQLTLTPDELRIVGIRNGFALLNEDGAPLGGAQGFSVTWTGVLLIEEGGEYRFFAGTPSPEGEPPGDECPDTQRWRVRLQRGQLSWILLSHGWEPDEAPSSCAKPLKLKRGAYDIVIDLVECSPVFERTDATRPTTLGFEVKYEGPDSGQKIIAIPFDKLFTASKDATLGELAEEDPNAPGQPVAFLDALYRSTLRDVRRTYERGFKALLFAARHGLRADPIADDGQSEIDYLLSQPEAFQGLSFFHAGPSFSAHRAWFVLNFFPVDDNYFPPDPSIDQRADPSVRRRQALFDWWERVFDYTELRTRAGTSRERPAWLLFHEASELHPDDPTHLLRHLAVDLSHAPLVLRYYAGHVLDATGTDLIDERWPVRISYADILLDHIRVKFTVKDIRDAQPDLWASNDPASEGGNENLTRFVRFGLIENSEPRRYDDLAKLNDGLRDRARWALISYLCRLDRVDLPWGGTADSARDLSDLLLLDVEAGLCQRASRIEEAISAVQAFVQRYRLGLEPDWSAHPELSFLWDRRFATFAVWQACKRHSVYRENWIEWQELHTARRSEGFRHLEDRLRGASLTVPIPAGLTRWEGGQPPPHPGIVPVQAREPSVLSFVHPPQVEALGLMGTRERHGRLTWLANINGPRLTPESPPNLTAAGMELEFGDKLPLWIEAAIRLGARFLRVAAAGEPLGSNTYRRFVAEPGCCYECDPVYPPGVDEYYFWLLDGSHFESVTQDAWVQSSTGGDPLADNASSDSAWHNPEDLPTLLDWPSQPTLYLCWARVHHGELKQPRRSHRGLRLTAETATRDLTLNLIGRFGDSLKFEVVHDDGTPLTPGAEAVVTGLGGSDAPGFRYDLVTDSAVVLPLLADPVSVPPLFLGTLPAYPYFLHFTPGAPLVPTLFFSQAIAVAATLRSHCRFESALYWYGGVFSPLHHDVRWCEDLQPVVPGSTALPPPNAEVHCCGGGEVSKEMARRRALTLEYLETLLSWGDTLMRANTPESFQQARLIFDVAARVLGDSPRTIQVNGDVDDPDTVATFLPAAAPLNPRLLSLYERIDDRRSLIHACLNAHRLRNGVPNRDMPYFGDNPTRDGWQETGNPCLDEAAFCCPGGVYRFAFVVQKANELAAETRTLGAALLNAYEKGDAEYLSSLRAGHERQILALGIEIRKEQWRENDWQVQALKITKEIAQTRRRYTQGLIDAGLNAGERDYQDLIEASNGVRIAGNVSEVIAEIMHFIPNVYVGTESFTELPIGSKIGYVFQAVARIARTTAESLNATAGLRLTEGGWERREDEWYHQVEVLDLEIEQIERQILAAERSRDRALRELNNHQRQLEHAGEVQDFLRDKFTSHELYLWMQKETAALYYRIYELALYAARKAERAYNYERGHTAERFLPSDTWDSLHEGLMAGERLTLAVKQMEESYLCKNKREYELTKHISLRTFAPLAFLQLKNTGYAEVELPEWLFDLDYPGHYMRRIKNVSVTIPCVTGPYTGIQCRLTLLSSITRVDPRLRGPLGECCEETPPRPAPPDPCACHGLEPESVGLSTMPKGDNGYPALSDDPRIVRQYAATSAIATSAGVNDSGLFELNFRDERYLPFEFAGAVSRWRIEMPPENNYFDFDSLSDFVLHLQYMAREGGDVLAQAAAEVASVRLPDGGVRLFDLRHEWPDAWARLQTRRPKRSGKPRDLELRFARDSFAFLPGRRKLTIVRLDVLFELPPPKPLDCECPPECAEPNTDKRATHTLQLFEHRLDCCDEEDCDCCPRYIDCVESAEWPGLYHGTVEVELGPLSSEEEVLGRLRFPATVNRIVQVFLLCGYRADRLPEFRC